MEFARSSHRHGFAVEEIAHVLANALALADLEPDADPPRVLAIGPDRAGRLAEVVWLDFPGGRRVVIHAMALRPKFYGLLPEGVEEL